MTSTEMNDMAKIMFHDYPVALALAPFLEGSKASCSSPCQTMLRHHWESNRVFTSNLFRASSTIGRNGFYGRNNGFGREARDDSRAHGAALHLAHGKHEHEI